MPSCGTSERETRRRGEGNMNTATATLRHEHQAILEMLAACEGVTRKIQAGDYPPPEILSGLLEFFQLFADRCHHGKEEDCLFPLLEQKGMAHHAGPIAVMLHEHEQGRALVRQMKSASETYAEGQKDAASLWAQSALGYVTLLRSHIEKEDNVLFVMAERILSESEQAELARKFECVEVEKMGEGTHERLHLRMHELSSKIFAGDRVVA
jgi:hemerythrin-like domain-containing protein